MIKYVIKRILLLIPVFLGVTFVIFAIVRLNPADPVIAILGINITDEQYAAKARSWGWISPSSSSICSISRILSSTSTWACPIPPAGRSPP